MPARISKMSTMLALALAAAVQAQQYPSDTKAGPNATGYLVYAYTDTQPTGDGFCGAHLFCAGVPPDVLGA